jgi:hypothetical protein
MALTILKKTPIHVVAMVTGAGAQTISLATDLIGTNETASTPTVNIGGIYWSVPGATAATIVRNSVTQWPVLGSYHFEFNGWSDNSNNTFDIVVTIPAGGGTVILELLKIGGYGNSQQRKTAGGDLLP